jgi:hypothetical protein
VTGAKEVEGRADECVDSDVILEQMELEVVRALGGDARRHHRASQPAHQISSTARHLAPIFAYKLGRSRSAELYFLLNRVSELMLFAGNLVVFAGCEILHHGKEGNDDSNDNFAL